MTFHLRHEWTQGAHLLGADLATCANCGTLRITEPTRHPEPVYMQHTRDRGRQVYTDAPPPCVEPVEHGGVAERVARMNAIREREAAVRQAIAQAPEEETR